MINKEKDYSQLYAEIYVWGILLAICVGSAMIIASLLGGCDTNRPPMAPTRTTDAINTPPEKVTDRVSEIAQNPTDPPIETRLTDIEVINELPGEPNLEPSVIIEENYETVIIPSNTWEYVGFVALMTLVVCLFGIHAIALWQSGQRK